MVAHDICHGQFRMPGRSGRPAVFVTSNHGTCGAMATLLDLDVEALRSGASP
jgi:hypothetical protein